MQEFDSISVSSYDAGSLSAQLNERSADGWEVVTILSAGSDVVAFLSRPASAEADTGTGDTGTATAGDAAVVRATAGEAATTDAVPSDSGSASEPAGWATAPETSSTADAAPAAEAAAAASSADAWSTSTGEPVSTDAGWSGETTRDDGWGTTGAAGSAAAAGSSPGTEQASSPAVPAGWFTDPSNRYELRYWDGSAWTEHVARGGQQYTDPPVA